MSDRLARLAETAERSEVVRAAAGNFLRNEWSLAQLRARFEAPDDTHAAGLWQAMQGLGWDGALFESALDADSFCALVEETGRSLAPTPLVPCVVARTLLHAAGVASTAKLPVLAHLEGERSTSPFATSLRATRSGAGFRLDGSKRFVAYGAQADRIITDAVDHEGRFGLFSIDAASEGLGRTSLQLLDRSPCAELSFDGVEVPAAARLASEGEARALFGEALALEATARCAELVGVAAQALDMAVEYARQRVAFDRPIGSFQAVQHRLVNHRSRIEVARALVQRAAAHIGAESGERDAAVAMAAFAALDGLRAVPEGALQVFGGIGTTWEHDIHLFLRRAATLCSLLGERSGHRETIVTQLTAS